jgi:hypothetical protein
MSKVLKIIPDWNVLVRAFSVSQVAGLVAAHPPTLLKIWHHHFSLLTFSLQNDQFQKTLDP